MPFFVPPAVAAGPASPPHLYNWNPGSQLINFRGAKAQVRSGKAGSRCMIGCMGDSTTAGYDGANVNRPVTSYPARLAAKLTALGLQAGCNGFVGDGNYPNGDTRIVNVGTGAWSGAPCFGGNMKTATGTANGFDFTPGVAFDRLNIDYLDQGTNTFTIQVDGGTATTITNAGTNNLKTAVLNLTGTNASVVSYRATANQTYIQGIRPWVSTSPAVEVINGGSGGAFGVNVGASTGYTPLSGVVAVKPQLLLVNYGINDANSSKLASDYQTAMTSIVTAMQAQNTDVIFLLPTPISTTASQALVSGGYYTALKAISDNLNVPVISWVDRYQSYAKASSQFGQTDNNHPPYAIYEDIATYLASLLTAA